MYNDVTFRDKPKKSCSGLIGGRPWFRFRLEVDESALAYYKKLVARCARDKPG